MVMVDVSEIESLRSKLPEGLKKELEDETLARFIRATGGDLENAECRLLATMKWRKEVKPETIECQACINTSGSHYMQVVGFCNVNRPVFYSCMALSPNKNFEDGKAHMISRFEQAIRMMPKGVEEWIWVSDFHGFGFADLNPSMARLFVDLLGTHYPERLGAYFLVDTPIIFQALWKVVKPWLDPVTAGKLVFVPFDAKPGKKKSSLLRTELLKYFGSDLTEWLIREMHENRDKSKIKEKAFSSREVYKQALEGELCERKPHDLRGTKSVFDCYCANPSLLLPEKQVA